MFPTACQHWSCCRITRHHYKKNTIHAVLTLWLLTILSTRLATVSMKAQTHLRWVFGLTVLADALTAKHPGLCLGYTLRKCRTQIRCFGQPPSGRRESLSSNSHVFLEPSTLVPKNSWKTASKLWAFWHRGMPGFVCPRPMSWSQACGPPCPQNRTT